MEQGSGQYSGMINIDQPANYVRISKEDPVRIRGWKVCDCVNAKFEVRLGNKAVEKIENESRQDVVNAFIEQYGGFMDKDTAGFYTDVDIRDYEEEIKDGRLTVTVGLYDENGNRIVERFLILIVQE